MTHHAPQVITRIVTSGATAFVERRLAHRYNGDERSPWRRTAATTPGESRRQRMDFIRINGSAVRITSIYQRTVPQDDGPPLHELELVVILRGTMAHRSFLALLAPGTFRVDVPDKSGQGWLTYEMEIITAYSSSSGPGEAAAYRHDLALRETPDSAARRAAEQPDQPDEETAPPPVVTPELEEDEDPDAPVDLSTVKVGGDATVWATALRQMTSPGSSKPAAPPEPPLETAELAGAEAVLVGLRLEALIEQLIAVGIVRRSSVDASFMRLVHQRFVAEATPVIGAKAAQRAAKSAVEE
jgi:hypothetical protein